MNTHKAIAEALKREEIADWLIRLTNPIGGWRIFHTATFDPGSWERPSRAARTPEEALDRYRAYMQERDRRKVTWVVGIERNPDYHALNQGYHCHAMWAMTDEIWRTSSFRRWANQWGNNKVEPVRVADHVQRYVSKYCLKENALWDLQINNGKVWLQQLLRVAA